MIVSPEVIVEAAGPLGDAPSRPIKAFYNLCGYDPSEESPILLSWIGDFFLSGGLPKMATCSESKQFTVCNQGQKRIFILIIGPGIIVDAHLRIRVKLLGKLSPCQFRQFLFLQDLMTALPICSVKQHLHLPDKNVFPSPHGASTAIVQGPSMEFSSLRNRSTNSLRCSRSSCRDCLILSSFASFSYCSIIRLLLLYLNHIRSGILEYSRNQSQ
jgi:hypothetical protein